MAKRKKVSRQGARRSKRNCVATLRPSAIMALPNELLVELLKRVPIASLPAMELVCRRFKDLVGTTFEQLEHLVVLDLCPKKKPYSEEDKKNLDKLLRRCSDKLKTVKLVEKTGTVVTEILLGHGGAPNWARSFPNLEQVWLGQPKHGYEDLPGLVQLREYSRAVIGGCKLKKLMFSTHTTLILDIIRECPKLEELKIGSFAHSLILDDLVPVFAERHLKGVNHLKKFSYDGHGPLRLKAFVQLLNISPKLISAEGYLCFVGVNENWTPKITLPKTLKHLHITLNGRSNELETLANLFGNVVTTLRLFGSFSAMKRKQSTPCILFEKLETVVVDPIFILKAFKNYELPVVKHFSSTFSRTTKSSPPSRDVLAMDFLKTYGQNLESFQLEQPLKIPSQLIEVLKENCPRLKKILLTLHNKVIANPEDQVTDEHIYSLLRIKSLEELLIDTDFSVAMIAKTVEITSPDLGFGVNFDYKDQTKLKCLVVFNRKNKAGQV